MPMVRPTPPMMWSLESNTSSMASEQLWNMQIVFCQLECVNYDLRYAIHSSLAVRMQAPGNPLYLATLEAEAEETSTLWEDLGKPFIMHSKYSRFWALIVLKHTWCFRRRLASFFLFSFTFLLTLCWYSAKFSEVIPLWCVPEVDLHGHRCLWQLQLQYQSAHNSSAVNTQHPV